MEVTGQQKAGLAMSLGLHSNYISVHCVLLNLRTAEENCNKLRGFFVYFKERRETTPKFGEHVVTGMAAPGQAVREPGGPWPESDIVSLRLF